jgi:simple sugar transport system permease protein
MFSILLGFSVSILILALTGYSPFEVIKSLLNGVFSKPKYISNVIIKSTPIILTGISVALAFKAGLFNIGAEGQFIAGSIASVAAGILFDLPAFFQILVVLFFGALFGALFGCLVGFLKSKFGIHEVISGIMLNWISLHICNFFVSLEMFHKPNSNNSFAIRETGYTDLKKSFSFLKNSSFSDILKTDINIGFFFAVILAILVAFLLNKTKNGYEIRAIGFNSKAAKFAGINIEKNIISVMLICGGISGLAASLTITGVSPHCVSILSGFENNGFNGLPVSLIAYNSPIGCIFSGLFFGILIYAGKSMQSELSTPSEIINIMIGIIVFFVSVAGIFPYLLEGIFKRRKKNE